MALLYRDRSLSCHLSSSRGFTLLEMVLVVFIMGVLASVSLTFVETQDQQWRYEETVAKADAIMRAVLDQQRVGNQPLISGFVVDNGVLPEIVGPDNLEPLISNSENSGDWFGVDPNPTWVSYGPKNPAYLVKEGATRKELANGFRLHKGYRGGYLRDGVDSADQLFDGWGAPFNVTSSATASYILSFSGQPNYTGFSRPLNDDRWQVSLSELAFEFTNSTGSDLLAGRVLAVLVFKNDKKSNNDDRWTTHHFTIPAIASGASLSMPAAITPQWKTNGATSAIDPTTVFLPVGEHLAVILPDEDYTEVAPSDFLKFRLYPGALPSVLSLEVTE